MVDENIVINCRSRIQIIDITNPTEHKTILSGIIPKANIDIENTINTSDNDRKET